MLREGVFTDGSFFFLIFVWLVLKSLMKISSLSKNRVRILGISEKFLKFLQSMKLSLTTSLKKIFRNFPIKRAPAILRFSIVIILIFIT